MKIDLAKSINAPFSPVEGANIFYIYLIAFGLTVIIAIITFVCNVWSICNPDLIDDKTEIPLLYFIIDFFIISNLVPIALSTPFLILPFGYLTETIKLELNNSEAIMPSWSGNWSKFFLQGLKLLFLLICYMLLIAIAFVLVISIIALISYICSHFSNGFAETFDNASLIVLTIFTMLLTIFIVVIILPFAIIRYISEKSFLAAFEVSKITKIILLNFNDYVLAIIVSVFLFITITINILGLVCSCVGIFLIPMIVGFFLPIVVFNLFTQIYKEPAENH